MGSVGEDLPDGVIKLLTGGAKSTPDFQTSRPPPPTLAQPTFAVGGGKIILCQTEVRIPPPSWSRHSAPSKFDPLTQYTPEPCDTRSAPL